jgi:hypothetical protein
VASGDARHLAGPAAAARIGRYSVGMLGQLGSRRASLVVAAVLFFGAALVVSWTQGADHLTLQLVAMGLGLVACLLAAMAAATNKREDQP